MNFKELVLEAFQEGFAIGQGTVRGIRAAARDLGWTEITNRSGDAPVSVLTPRRPEQALPRSMSALFGLAAQPLHTDGAHTTNPPDYIVLIAERPSSTPTLIWAASPIRRVLPAFARHGVFLVDSGREAFFATAVREDATVAYDPGCMTPCDLRARQTVDYFAACTVEAKNVVWSNPGQVLLIDNRHALHARAAVEPDDLERQLFRLAYHAKP